MKVLALLIPLIMVGTSVQAQPWHDHRHRDYHRDRDWDRRHHHDRHWDHRHHRPYQVCREVWKQNVWDKRWYKDIECQTVYR